MNLKNTIFILIIILFLFQMMVMKQDAKLHAEQSRSNKPTVMVSTFSLFDITKHIAGDTIDLEMILPFGVDAHSYEPTPAQVAKIYDSSLVVYSGAGLEPWCKSFDFTNRVINMSELVDLKELSSSHKHKHSHSNESQHLKAHHMNKVDPHYWLDVDNMVRAAISINKELIKLLPQNKKIFTENKDLYISMLKSLDNDYKKALSSCKLDTILVNHNAYSYLSNRYGFEVKSLNGLSPEAQPNAKNMIHLMEHIKKYNVGVIFYENFASDKAMKNISKEINVSIDSLHPLGNLTKDEAQKKLSYEDIMRKNLQKISSALECK